ncbi:Glutathione S-transferase [Rhodovastum atsumiense]|uniref:Glutathione S-transferase family protein n=1 Tax=Rhodovastum atsumiense TaxID=504468 RepID=A0A5M6IRG3_9PROT|nr:glutathione S-transferase family protein [Rhodovastum atsumiense]KAA5610854.1 glutathione S-transferase family protein [Rhodovastum atsumiense]CAH2602091.1 Glutathione S-transferase [Rhodovastum atsumiense]
MSEHYQSQGSTGLILYGIPKSRTYRCIWAAEEAGLPYTVEPVSYGAESKTPAFRAINPNGKIPAMRDGALVLFESLAITLHIARRAGPPLMPEGDDAARVLQWTLWVATEVEHHIIRWAANTFYRPPAERVPEEAAAASATVLTALSVLEGHLAGRDWVVGDGFSIADLNIASVLYPSYAQGFGLGSLSVTEAWLRRCLARPAAVRTLALREG